MWLLDTDHLTILERGGGTALPLQLRLGRVPAGEVDTTIVNYEEQMRGWLAQASRANTLAKMVDAYVSLQAHIETFRAFLIFPFDDAASRRLEQLRKARLGVGTQDLKIAAVCLARDATLLTRNLKDFQRVPGLRAEDWSA